MSREALKIIRLAQLLNVPLVTLNDETLDEVRTLNSLIMKLESIPYIPYPVSLSTVDMAPIKYESGKWWLCLGRKRLHTSFQFLGGFRDPGETSEFAAARELYEEATINVFESNELRKSYIGSYFVNDSRYRESCHKITTSFFVILVQTDVVPIANDDIEEVKWFSIEELEVGYKEIIRNIHQYLFLELREYLKTSINGKRASTPY